MMGRVISTKVAPMIKMRTKTSPKTKIRPIIMASIDAKTGSAGGMNNWHATLHLNTVANPFTRFRQ